MLFKLNGQPSAFCNLRSIQSIQHKPTTVRKKILLRSFFFFFGCMSSFIDFTFIRRGTLMRCFVTDGMNAPFSAKM